MMMFIALLASLGPLRTHAVDSKELQGTMAEEDSTYAVQMESDGSLSQQLKRKTDNIPNDKYYKICYSSGTGTKCLEDFGYTNTLGYYGVAVTAETFTFNVLQVDTSTTPSIDWYSIKSYNGKYIKCVKSTSGMSTTYSIVLDIWRSNSYVDPDSYKWMVEIDQAWRFKNKHCGRWMTYAATAPDGPPVMSQYSNLATGLWDITVSSTPSSLLAEKTSLEIPSNGESIAVTKEHRKLTRSEKRKKHKQ